MNVLITGGAGFIGMHLARKLLDRNITITILDNFSPQVHGGNEELDLDIASSVKLIRGDIRDRDTIGRALYGQDAVVHLAAETGTGQSMYKIAHYESVNIGGTALMLDCIVNNRRSSIKKIIVASSRAIYGEGQYFCYEHGTVYPKERSLKDLRSGQFELRCPICCESVVLDATDETAPLNPTSMYGLTKQVQEQMVLMFAKTLGISAYALRYQNVYGNGQSLNNPYTGILAIFSNLSRLGEDINIFEDGMESRDFVYVDDATEATALCLSEELYGVEAINVGSGVPVTVLDVAHQIVEYFGSRSKVMISGAFRHGDIRHNIASMVKAKEQLGYCPNWQFDNGIRAFLDWAKLREKVSRSAYDRSLSELREKGLMLG